MTSRRFWFVVVLAALLVVAIVVGNGNTQSSAVAGGTVPSGAATVWFCPGPPPILQNADEVTLANLGDAPAAVVVTNLTDKGDTVRKALTVDPRSTQVHKRNEFGGPGSLTIETFGSRMAIEEGVEAPQVEETGVCATQASTQSLFAAGSTMRGEQDWLVIDNPYAADAKVDVALRTASGVRRPDVLQSLDIARRSRYVAAIHSLVVREPHVAIEVTARIGSVVSAETMIYTADAGTPGVATTLGTPAPSSTWYFAGGTTSTNGHTSVAIANEGTNDAQVDVQVIAESKQPVAPASLTVPEDTVAAVQLGNCPSGAKAGTCVSVPDGTPYAVQVRSSQQAPIVAQIIGRFSDTGKVEGAVTAIGGATPAREWVFARTRVNGEKSTTLSFFNPGAATVHVGVTFVHDGKLDQPKTLRNLAVKGGTRLTVTVAGDRNRTFKDAAIMIDGDGPVFVERSIVAVDGAVRSVGVAG